MVFKTKTLDIQPNISQNALCTKLLTEAIAEAFQQQVVVRLLPVTLALHGLLRQVFGRGTGG
jgi:hypothetical protein